MDHDAMLKDVTKLKAFRDRAESAIAFVEGLKAAGVKLPNLEDTADAESEWRFKVDHRLDSLEGGSESESTEQNTIGDRVTSLETRLSALNTPTDTTSIEQRLAALEGSKAEGEAFSDRLTAMLDWFEQNKDGLDILLSLDGIVDEPEAPVAEPAAPADTSQPAVSTEAPAAATDAPGTVQG